MLTITESSVISIINGKENIKYLFPNYKIKKYVIIGVR